jgi:NAD(P)-dependent dehydrogenase (short-subunit alcohol dehydrogenase family)
MKSLEGKVAIVTGGTQGLGLGIAGVFLREGAHVVITGRNTDKGARAQAYLASVGDVLFVPHDVSCKDQAEPLVNQVADLLGGIDILVNNAQTIGPWERSETVSPLALERELHSGLFGSLWLAQAVFPHMREKHWGRIVNAGSLASAIGMRNMAAYAANKAAIQTLTRTLANEWGRCGITVNCILPAGRSPNFANLLESREEVIRTDSEMAEVAARMDLSGCYQPYLLGEQEAIGEAVLGIVSDLGQFLTGQSFFVDGGQHLWALNQYANIAGQRYQE